VLVNNAGLGALGATSKVGADAIEKILQININALTHLSIAGAAAFAGRGGATVINISSIVSSW
jgi:uncharacterized protein